MFAIPLVGLRGVEPRPPLWVKVAALSGLLMTLLYVTLSIVPIIQGTSQVTFALKISGLIVITNLVGLAVFLGSGRRRRFHQRTGVAAVTDTRA